MKKTLLALALLGCLLVSAVACTDTEAMDRTDTENDNGTGTTVAVSVTDEGPAGSDENGTPSDDDDDNQQGGISDGGANTEGGWGPIHPVG